MELSQVDVVPPQADSSQPSLELMPEDSSIPDRVTGLLSLPLELRELIYRHVLDRNGHRVCFGTVRGNDCPRVVVNNYFASSAAASSHVTPLRTFRAVCQSDCRTHGRGLQLLRVNKAIYEEVRGVVHKHTSCFAFGHNSLCTFARVGEYQPLTVQHGNVEIQVSKRSAECVAQAIEDEMMRTQSAKIEDLLRIEDTWNEWTKYAEELGYQLPYGRDVGPAILAIRNDVLTLVQDILLPLHKTLPKPLSIPHVTIRLLRHSDQLGIVERTPTMPQQTDDILSTSYRHRASMVSAFGIDIYNRLRAKMDYFQVPGEPLGRIKWLEDNPFPYFDKFSSIEPAFVPPPPPGLEENMFLTSFKFPCTMSTDLEPMQLDGKELYLRLAAIQVYLIDQAFAQRFGTWGKRPFPDTELVSNKKRA